MDKVIKHYGILRRSGRYPWGSGKNPLQRSTGFLQYVQELKAQGLSEKEIAAGLGIKTTDLRRINSIAKAEKRAADSTLAMRLYNKGMSKVAIGERMGINESSVRALLDPVLKERFESTRNTALLLKKHLDDGKAIDVGLGVEADLGVSRTKLKTAIHMLEEEGYHKFYVQTQQLGTGKYTSIEVLAPPGMEYKDLYKNRADIKTITEHSFDGGRSFLGLEPIQSVSGDRVMVRYKEDGGGDKDGVIELRRGVSDLDMGNSKYAQVRIGVDGTHFLKGMAIYSDNMPNGVDIVYNSSKHNDVPKYKVFKEMKDDPDNPFGATIKRGGQRGALNILSEQGDWTEWSRNISSQVLSKQKPTLAKKQLELALALQKDEYDEISRLTNPVLKKKLLLEFADSVDAASVELKAAALPRQASHVILPITSLKKNEVFAPMYNDGENVVLIRHPHGGIFEIPELTVNNKNQEARKVISKDAPDAIGIHPTVASKLSGADFDGDTVIVIPNTKGFIKSSPEIKTLKDFDTKEAYPPYDGMRTIDGGVYNATLRSVDYGGKKPRTAPKQLEMGNVSNLITDMTIKGATENEIVRAVKHSMVVIDSEKHHLNYKQSEIDNGIAELKKTYQQPSGKGASTLISRSKSKQYVDYREEGKYIVDPNTGKKKRQYINPKTGEKEYEYVSETFVNKQGNVIKRQSQSTKMSEAKNAFDLSSGTKMESVYAEHANALKSLANKARLDSLKVPNLKYSPSAKHTYSKEVESLKAKLLLSLRNKPLERKAQLLADSVYRAKVNANPEMDKADKKRLKGQALDEARRRIGAKKDPIVITDREWDAIQTGAITHNTMFQILQNTDTKALKQRALPRTAYKMTDAKVARAKLLSSAGHTPAEIASMLGVSTTTIVTTLE